MKHSLFRAGGGAASAIPDGAAAVRCPPPVRSSPVESYETAEGCTVVSQVLVMPDIVIERVALLCRADGGCVNEGE